MNDEMIPYNLQWDFLVNKACQNLPRGSTLENLASQMTELLRARRYRRQQEIRGEHYGPYGTACMNTGQLDAGECWKCQIRTKDELIRQYQEVIDQLHDEQRNDPACPYCNRAILRGSTVQYYNKRVYHSGCLDATGHTVDAQPEDRE